MNRRMAAVIVLIAITAAALYLLLSKGVMPLQEDVLEAFQEANSTAMQEFYDDGYAETPAVQSAIAFRIAIEEIGYDPDKTVLYWLSPDFSKDLNQGNPAKLVSDKRLTDQLVATALGDGASDEEFVKILSCLNPELQKKAIARRNLRN